MALSENGMTAADIAAVTNNDGFGGNNAWWIILLFIILGGGWNNYGGNGTAYVDSSIQRGFDQAAITNSINNISSNITDYQIANMQQQFGLQNLIAGLQATIVSENCADRQALNEGIRDVIANQTAVGQMILDKMCQQDLEAARRENENLRTQLNMANLAASQTAQTTQLMTDNAAQTALLLQKLTPATTAA